MTDSTPTDFMKIAKTSDIPLGTMRKFSLPDREVLIVHVEGGFYALNNACPHMKGDLSKGTLEGSLVVCPRHKAKIDVRTGDVVSNPQILFLKLKTGNAETFEVQVQHNDLLIKSSSKASER